ncbi:MAG: ABC transporter permease [Planctomycetota bacterium]
MSNETSKKGDTRPTPIELNAAADGYSFKEDGQTKQGGASLTQDALRRLRKNRVAVASFWTLVVVGLLAFFTPLLPLTPPDHDNTGLAFASPLKAPDRPGQPGERVKLIEKTQPLTAQRLAEVRARIEEARSAGGSSKSVEDLTQRPYSELGYPELGPLARAMVRARYAVFGEFTIGPICGRDNLGRDILSRVFWGARVSMIVGIVATIVSLVIGVAYGAVSGYVGGWVDDAMMRLVDVLYSIPFIFVVIYLITLLDEPSIKAWLESYGIDRITIFYLVVGAIYWLTMARVVRGQVLSLKNELFVEAARSIGVSQTGIIFRHIVPNLFSIVIVYLTLTIPRVILFEAFLSFLGLGVQPPDVSWGLLANEGIKVITPVKTYWWLILFPSLAIGVTLFALNFLGDGLRDAFDPRLKDS